MTDIASIPAPSLVGRTPERSAIEQLLAGARESRSGVIVFRGDPGVGKTALLDEAVALASAFAVARAAGVESESSLPFAALQQLCSPFLGLVDHLPPPQREALESAFGLATGSSPDRFLVGLAALTLLAAAAETTPLLCVVDDAHWLDRESAETLAFVARRIGADAIAMVFAFTGSPDGSPLAALPQRSVEPLALQDAKELLVRAAGLPVAEPVVRALFDRTGGNPLGLVELVLLLTPDQVTGHEAMPEPFPYGGRLEETFLRQVRALPDATQLLLLLAAAETRPEARLVWAAAAELGIGPDAAAPAERAGLLRIGSEVAFRHPSVRRAIYAGATTADRQWAHSALALVGDPDRDRHHRAWHRAAATLVPDEAIAAELATAAELAIERGGFSVAANILERSAELTPDATIRAERLLDAAVSALIGGAVPRVEALIAKAANEAPGPLQTALLHRLEAEMAFGVGHDAAAPALMSAAASELCELDLERGRHAHLRAIYMAIYFSGIDPDTLVTDVAAAALAAPRPAPADETVVDRFLDALALLYSEGHAAAAVRLREVLGEVAASGDRSLLGVGMLAAAELWDHELASRFGRVQVEQARLRSLYSLPLALLSFGAIVEVPAGRFTSAADAFAEAREAAAAIGVTWRGSETDALVAAWRGDADEAYRLLTIEGDDARSHGTAVSRYANHHRAVLENGLGHYPAALAAALAGSRDGTAFPAMISLPELVEAAARTGDLETARAAAARLEAMTVPSGTAYARGMNARAQALIASGAAADAHYREAIEQLGRAHVTAQLARAHLLYGEWLRRERRKVDAREQLRIAHEQFVAMGAAGFAERARVELEATGEHLRRRTTDNWGDLTPQEAQIARLVAAGSSNPEIAAQLFLSRRTIEYHLSKVFRKLEVGSRTQLTRLLTGSTTAER